MSRSRSPTSPLLCTRTCYSHVWQPSQFRDQPPLLQKTLDCRFDAFLVKFRLQKVELTENYVGNRETPPTFTEEASPELRKSVWLSRHELMLHDDGAILCSLLRGFHIPEVFHGPVLRKIETAAVSAGTSRMPIVVYLYTFTVKTVVVMPQYSSHVDEVLDTVILESMESYEPKPTPATESSVRDLEKFRFQQGSSSVQECSICLEEFQTGSKVTRMPCSHVYHGKCIVKWLTTSHSCPLCRYPMPI